MSKFRTVIIIFGYWLFFTTVSFSEPIEFQEISTYDIPGITEIDEIFIANFGVIEKEKLLIREDSHLSVVSSYLDSVIFETDLDSNYTQSKITFGDANRDSIADLIIMYMAITDRHSDSAVIVDFYNGSDGYFRYRHYFTNYDPYGDFPYFLSGNLEALKLIDTNLDGFNELMLSYQHIIMGNVMPETHTIITGGVALRYFSFPDSLLWNKNLVLTEPFILTSGGNGNILLINSISYYENNGPGVFHEDEQTTTKKIIRIDENDSSHNVYYDELYFSCGNADLVVTNNYLRLLCAGNMDTSTPEAEFMSYFSFYRDCRPLFDSSINHSDMRMYRMTSPIDIELVWAKDYIAYDLFIYLPNHPGYFFAFDDGRFIQFDGSDGSEIQATENIPIGNRKWEYPYGDNQPHLVVTNGGQITVFKPSVVTSVDGEDQLPLPGNFAVGRPYPNPFNATQTIPVKAIRGHHLTVEVYNLLGQKVDNIYDGPAPGASFDLSWNAERFASGIYFIRAASNGETQIVRSLLLK